MTRLDDLKAERRRLIETLADCFAAERGLPTLAELGPHARRKLLSRSK
jgi:hypothetical protein